MSADLNIESELAICEAATPGPWKAKNLGDGLCFVVNTADDQFQIFMTAWGEAEDDANCTFAAHARTGYPVALRRIQELEAKLSRLAELASGKGLEIQNSDVAKYLSDSVDHRVELFLILGIDSTKEQG